MERGVWWWCYCGRRRSDYNESEASYTIVPFFKLALTIVEEGCEAAQQVLNHAADLVVYKREKHDREIF